MREPKKTYTTPKLIVHGTVEQITLQDPPGKEAGAGDVQATQWPYGKIPDGPDHHGGHSRS